jgi:hypothetical protein
MRWGASLPLGSLLDTITPLHHTAIHGGIYFAVFDGTEKERF